MLQKFMLGSVHEPAAWLTKSNALLASKKQAKTGVFLCMYLATTFLMVPVQRDVDIPFLKPIKLQV